MNKKNGFTIYELLITIAIIAAASPFIYSAIKDLMQKRTAMEYADYSKTYANRFIENIESNYGEYYMYAQNNPTKTQFIPFSKIKNTIHGFMNWGVIPCVAMRYESANKEIQSVMFYTNNGTKARSISKGLGIKAMNEFGSGGGYNESGIVNGINGTWALAKNNHFMESSLLSACDTNSLTENGLVINLNMLTNFPRATTKSSSTGGQYLGRVRDDKSKFGESNNENTMQTDIIMQNNQNFNGIFISGNDNSKAVDKPIYLGYSKSEKISKVYKKYGDGDIPYLDNNGLVVVGGGVQTETLKINHSADAYSSCSRKEVGTIVKENPIKNGVREASYLLCGYNMTRCVGYCFLPVNYSINYTFNDSDKVDKFSCPSGMFIEPNSVVIGTNPDFIQEILEVDSDCIKFSDMKGSSIRVKAACKTYSYDPRPYNLKGGGNSIDETGTYRYSGTLEILMASYRSYKPNPDRDSSIAHCKCDNQIVRGGNTAIAVLTGVICSTSPSLFFEAK